MRVVVTGGCGFIGSHVVDNLIRAGHEVLVIDIAVHPLNPGARYKKVDILDPEALEAAVSGSDAIFHLAAASDVDLIAADPLSAVKVYVSTKLATELLAHSYLEMYGQHFTILRYGIPYGPRMRDALVVARFARAALAGLPITIAGTGEQQRNYVYVEDLADAHVRALSSGAEDQTLALEGDTPVSVREVAETVLHLAGPVPVRYVPARPADYDGRSVSNALAKEVLGWSPSTSFTEGVRRYLDWCRTS